MAVTRGSPDDDGYKRFTEDINNVSYGSAITSRFIIDYKLLWDISDKLIFVQTLRFPVI